MKVFLFNSKLISAISKKEEITEDTFLITEAEEKLIRETQRFGGFFWIAEDGSLGISGVPPAPTSDYQWDDGTKSWIIDIESKNARLKKERKEVWEKIKKKRYQACQGGVYIESVGKWFHTDLVSEIGYQQLINNLSLGIWVDVKWKTMSGDFVDMTEELLKEIHAKKFSEYQLNYFNAERHHAQLKTCENPLAYDFSSGWTEEYIDSEQYVSTYANASPA
ncbi:DUF4376 domain-containing protein [Phocoenobacter skyensis]|uniref:DUF4376 domain-containing protein n=1 Tax=Phocoenobacter skyensis TaxID=97481 RepID=A0A1H8A3B2_9PAST|nr:DUF4376 domain-containing protein [Pasteurella skyensis]MDP8184425.1 DUF4376 domain-containing protein [Pasteurella skyensis]QLB22574.1 hypothetical protein A6B44_04890 [Pasteurella skyensis]SEM64269.1 protein of unknown function [Pasteurella skyensis]